MNIKDIILTAALTPLLIHTQAEARPARNNQVPVNLWSCGLCHISAGGAGPRTVFGEDVNNGGLSGSSVDWPAVCNLDSDGDGATNGAELGDPNCEWRLGDAQLMFSATDPNDPTDFPEETGGEEVAGDPAGEEPEAGEPAGEEAPEAGEESPEAGEEAPEAGEEAPEAGEEAPEAGEEAPEAGEEAGEEAPEAGEEAPEAGEEAPEAGEEAPEAGEEAPEAGEEAPEAGEEAPEAGEEAPEAGEPADMSGDDADDEGGCEARPSSPLSLGWLIALLAYPLYRRREGITNA